MVGRTVVVDGLNGCLGSFGVKVMQSMNLARPLYCNRRWFSTVVQRSVLGRGVGVLQCMVRVVRRVTLVVGLWPVVLWGLPNVISMVAVGVRNCGDGWVRSLPITVQCSGRLIGLTMLGVVRLVGRRGLGPGLSTCCN